MQNVKCKMKMQNGRNLDGGGGFINAEWKKFRRWWWEHPTEEIV
ncbi:MAG: hypothetical protein NT007_01465 [Candidatus Kapabacteria bacterium]|nr:hypothetical protein [Candidatus Kapabacteria bacterium]